MIVNNDGTKPIYMQIAEWVETEILNGNFVSEDKVYSQYQLAEMFNINPATAAKGLSLLVEDHILYKKRGLGMFVTNDALELIRHKRKNQTLKRLIKEIVLESGRLGVSENELISMIKEVAGEETTE
ncbi:GntR family transcriptional regulator [Sutcliffiella cohnii]|uniref:GntR family transcriptional regulator n=1 Tax=Sutcliffiella cohnii TaxID=33932 RepID=A0A223KLY1_9BACI|nr:MULTISPECIES: GntR family transcriptional regulator [Sutcliffiella]AST90377.1 GntR family transcriptional regulator [Sutcliffiella cohnii]MED4017508.1 GntR family transcriptional regulator [Sutcliffiella cohnii]WBL16032.1 GntR family transcriptional regulator [Sutcliffiella sp. NC1]